MNELLPYILKSTLCLSLLYLTFRMVMRKESFFALNRSILLVIVICSMVIPLINLPYVIQPEIQKQLMPTLPVIENQLPEFHAVADAPQISRLENGIAEKSARPFPFMKIIGYIYLSGVFISLLFLFHGLITLLLLFRKAEIQKKVGYKMLIIEKDIPAFSFWKLVFISRADYNEHGSTIIAHEQQHIRLGHFYDLLLLQTVKMAHWFNPIIYWLIQDLKAIHEYQADQHTLTQGIDASKYQLLIIEKGVGHQRLALANSFNHCQIKQRITMMNNQKTGKAWRWKVAAFLPLLALLLMAFGRRGENVPMEVKSSQPEPSPIVGTWKLVSYNYNGGEELAPVSEGTERIKYITDKNFNWVQYVGEDKIVNNSAGGSYTYSGENYIEKIEYGGQGMAGYIGKEQKFIVKINNNKMELSGALSDGLKIKEVWEKYQPSDKTSMIAPSSSHKEKHIIWLENNGNVRYDNSQTTFDKMAEKVKSGIKENPQLQFEIFIEEGNIDEQLGKIKEILKASGYPKVQLWSFYVENGPESNGQMSSTVHSKTMDIKW